MTTTLWPRAVDDPAGADPTRPETAPRDWRRRALRWLGIAAGALVLAMVVIWSAPRAASEAAYHPNNAGLNGARALARVLAGQGIPVVVAAGQPALVASRIDSDTTVVVSQSIDLRAPTIETLRTQAGPARRLVLINPTRPVLRQLAPSIGMRVAGRKGVAGGCASPDVRPDETVSRTVAEYQLASATTCFVTEGYAAHLTATAPGIRELVLVGSTDVITNESIDERDNAAVILRTLGHAGRVVWYVPDLRDVPITGSANRGQEIYPPWFGSAVVFGATVVLAVMWWRGRRFGRLVTEPLPVVVRALETTESRARMYQRAQDHPRAAAVLRAATRHRLALVLGLPTGVSTDVLLAAVPSRSGRPNEEIRWLLAGPAPRTDTELLNLAADLVALEKEIRRS